MRTVVAVAALALVASACSTSNAPAPLPAPEGTGQALPSWLERVFPPPGSDALPVDSIQVVFSPDFTEPAERVRLLVDGIDVTVHANRDPGRIVYDPTGGPVSLEPGRHTVEVRRTAPPAFGEQIEVLDAYEWSFQFR